MKTDSGFRIGPALACILILGAAEISCRYLLGRSLVLGPLAHLVRHLFS